LSNVMSRRSSTNPRASTSEPGLPGAASRIHKTSCLSRRRSSTQSAGIFSFAQSRMIWRSSVNGENFFFVQSLLSIRHTGANLFGSDSVIARDFLLRPALRDKAENELDRQSRATNHRLANKHGGIGSNAFAPVHL